MTAEYSGAPAKKAGAADVPWADAVALGPEDTGGVATVSGDRDSSPSDLAAPSPALSRGRPAGANWVVGGGTASKGKRTRRECFCKAGNRLLGRRPKVFCSVRKSLCQGHRWIPRHVRGTLP